MVNRKLSRSDWVAAGLEALAGGGVEAVRVEALARGLGVTKGGFYGYFADRAELLDAMVDAWEDDVTTGIAEQVGARGGGAREQVAYLSEVVSGRDGPTRAVATELAIRDWARRDARIAQAVSRVDQAQTAFLRSLFAQFCDAAEAESRTVIAMSTRLAAQFIDFAAVTEHDVRELVTRRLLE